MLRTHWTNESLNCLDFLERKNNYHLRIQTFLIIEYTEMKSVCDILCKSVRGFSCQKQNHFVPNDVTVQWLIAGRYSQNLVEAECTWPTDNYIAMIGSPNSTPKGIIQPKWNSLWCSNGNSWIKACRTSRLVSCEPWKQAFYRSCCVMTS